MSDEIDILIVDDPDVVAVAQPDLNTVTETVEYPIVVESPAIQVVTVDGDVHVVDEVKDIQIVTVGEVGPPGPTGAAGSGGSLTISAGGTSESASAVTFSNSNGVSFGITAGVITGSVATNYQSQGAYLTTAQPVGAYLTTAMASNRGSDFMGTNTALTANGVSMTADSGGLSLNFPAFLTTAQPVGAYLTTAMLSNAATISNVNFSAGTTSGLMSAVTFENSNGVSFGLNAGTVTATVATNYQSQGAYLTTAMASNLGSDFVAATAAFAGTNASGTIASNGISVSVGNYITTARASNDAIGLNTALTANGVSWTVGSEGLSLNIPAFLTTAQPVGAYLTTAMLSNAATISNINFSAGTTSQNLSKLTFADSNGISFGLNGSVVTATVATNYQAPGAYLTTAMASDRGSDFMGTNTALTANGVSMTANSSGLSLNFPAFLTTAQPVGAYLTTARASNDAIGLNTALTGNGVAWTVNSAGLSLDVPAFLTTAMASNAATISNLRVSAGTTSNLLSAITFADSNGVSFGLNAGTLTATVATNYQSQGAYLTTAALSQNTSNYAGLSTAFDGANVSGSITLNTAGLHLSVSVAGPQAGVGVEAGTRTATTAGAIRFETGNGITFGLDAVGGSVMTASHNGLTTAMASNRGSDFVQANAAFAGTNASGTIASNGISVSVGNYITTAMLSNAATISNMRMSAGTTSNLLSAVTFADSNGVSFGMDAGTITATVATNYQSQGAYLTTARASNDAIGLNTALTGNGVAWTVNSSGLSLNMPAFLTTAMASNAATISNLRVSAGTTSNLLSALTFADSNGVSFGLNAGTITATVATNYQSAGAYLTTAMASDAATISNINFSAGTTSQNLSKLTFADSNGVSFGLNGSVVTATVATNYQSQGAYLTTAMASNRGSDFVQANAAFAGTNASGTIASNGISVSVAAPQAGVGVEAGTRTATTAGTLRFETGNGITFGLNGVGGSVMTASHNGLTTAMASNRGSDFVAATAAFAGTNASGTIASNGISVSVGNYITTAMLSNAATISNINFSAGTTSQNLSKLTFADSNGISFGLNGSVVTGTVATNYQSQGAYLTTAALSNHSHGNPALALTNLSGTTASNSAGLTLSLSAAAPAAGVGIEAGTRTATTAGTLRFETGNGITFGLNGVGGSVMTASHNALTTAMASNRGSDFVAATAAFAGTNASGTIASNGISVSVGNYITTAMLSNAATISNIRVSGGTTSNLLSAVTFADSNGVSFGLNAGTLTATVKTDYQTAGAYLTTAMLSNAATISNINLSAGTTSQNLSKLTFADSNGVSFGLNGSVVTATVATNYQSAGAYLTTAALSGDTSKYIQNWKLTGNAAGTTSSAQGTDLWLAGGNGVTISGSSNTLSISVATNYQSQGAYLTTAALSNHSHGDPSLNLTNLSGTTASNSAGFTLSLSAAAPGGGGMGMSAGTQSVSTGTVVFANSNNITFGMSGSNQITASFDPINIGVTNSSANGTTGTVDGAGGQYLFFGGSNITISQSINGSSGSLSIIGNDSAYGGWLEPNPATNTATIAPVAGSWYFVPFVAPLAMSGGRFNFLHVNTSTAGIFREATGALASNTTGTKSQAYTYEKRAALFSQGTGSNSTRLESFWSNSFSFGWSNSLIVSVTGGANSLSVSASHSLSYVSDIDLSGAAAFALTSSSTHGSNTATSMGVGALASIGQSFRSMVSNSLVIPIGLNTTLSPGNYWLAVAWSQTRTSSLTNMAAMVSGLDFSQINQVGISKIEMNSLYRNFGSTSVAPRSVLYGVQGVYTAAANMNPPQFVEISSDIDSVASNWVPYFNYQVRGLTK